MSYSKEDKDEFEIHIIFDEKNKIKSK
jgi:hypothetical protein